jgi:2-octaprenyl-3-methyl-6-methoxy-1,4-benzoquinol hydroxylase
VNRRAGVDAVVVGAGVVGAAAALGLARQGLRVAILEAYAPAPWSSEAPDLKVYALAPDAILLLERLGAWAPVRAARAHPYRRMRVWDAAGGGELCFDADAFGRAELGHIVEHGLLVDRLWQALAREPGIELHCPSKVRGIVQDEDGVQVEHEQGALRARMVFGADGAASRVRELAGIGVSEHDYGQRGLVAYVRTALAHEDTAWQRFLPGGPLAFLPCGDGRCSIVWSLPEAEAQRLLQVEPGAFDAELTRSFDARLGEVRVDSARAAFPLRRRLADPMLQDRVALLGDAAHAVHPLAGQGVNLGLRDVADLLDVTTTSVAAGRAFDSPQALQRWARRRFSENTVAAHAFEGINRVFSNEAPVPTLLRGHLLGFAGKLPPVARALWRRAAGV